MAKPYIQKWRAQHVKGRLYLIVAEDLTPISYIEGSEEDVHLAALAPTLLEMVEELLAELERIVKLKGRTKG